MSEGNEVNRKKEHLWIRRLVILAALLALIIVALPFGLQFGIQKGLTMAGAKQVEIEDVDFNPFTGILAVKNLKATTSLQPEIKLSQLTIEIEWLPLFEKHLLIRSLMLKGTHLKIEQHPKKGLIIGGIALPVSAPESQPKKNKAPTEWGIGLGKIELLDNAIQFQSPGFSTDFALDDLRLANLFSWTPRNSADFSFDMKVNKSPISGDLAISAFAEKPSFKGRLKIDGMIIDRYLSLAGDALDSLKGQISTDLNFSAIVEKKGISYRQNGQIKVSELQAGSADFKLNQQELKWDGDVSFSLKNKKIAAVFKGDLTANNHQSNLGDSELTAALNRLGWNGEIEFNQIGKVNELKVLGALNLNVLKIETAEIQLEDEKINWDGNILLTQNTDTLKTTSKGTLTVNDHRSNLTTPELDVVLGVLGWNGEIAFNQTGKTNELKTTGLLNINALTFKSADIQLKEEEINWDGAVSFAQDANTLKTSSKGTLTVNNHQSSLASPELDIAMGLLDWKGETLYQKDSEADKLTITGQVTGDNLDVNNRATQLDILKLENLTLKDLAINQLDSIQLSKVLFKKLTIAKKEAEKKALIETAQISLDKLHLQKLSDLEIGKIDIESMNADININKQGNLALMDELIDGFSSKTTEKQPPKEQGTKPSEKGTGSAIKIGGIKLHGKSQIDFNTAAYDHAVTKTIQLKQFAIGEIDNRSPKKRTPFNLDATVNKHSKLSLKGKLTPFSKKLNLNADVNFKAFELPEFSPLIRQELGYDIQSGQLDADLKIGIKQDIIDGKTKIEIHGLVMEPADADKMAKMTQQLAMPLDSALSLLRDENDDIKLEIPIKGDIANPDFDIGDVINTAMGNALQGTVTSYLKYALQPYGLIYMAAEKAYGAATAVSLDAVQFKPGEQTLSDQSKTYLERIGKLLQERPGLRIRVCGFATASDRLKLIEQKKAPEGSAKKVPVNPPETFKTELLEMAKQRAASVKSHLVSTYKIGAKRLFTCLPKVTEEKSLEKPKGPRVELLI